MSTPPKIFLLPAPAQAKQLPMEKTITYLFGIIFWLKQYTEPNRSTIAQPAVINLSS
jgi:hypothetical protein